MVLRHFLVCRFEPTTARAWVAGRQRGTHLLPLLFDSTPPSLAFTLALAVICFTCADPIH